MLSLRWAYVRYLNIPCILPKNIYTTEEKKTNMLFIHFFLYWNQKYNSIKQNPSNMLNNLITIQKLIKQHWVLIWVQHSLIFYFRLASPQLLRWYFFSHERPLWQPSHCLCYSSTCLWNVIRDRLNSVFVCVAWKVMQVNKNKYMYFTKSQQWYMLEI